MRVVYLSDDECAPCAEIEEKLRPYLDGGEIEKLSVSNDEEGMEIFEILGDNDEGTIPKLVLLHQVNEKDYNVAASFDLDRWLTQE